ncbi:hypothetical protein D3C72_1698580 [compost metagenome]
MAMAFFHTRPDICFISSSGAPSSWILPPASTAMRGHRSATSSTMWVDRMTTTFSPISASRLRKRLRSSGSRPAVGSSTMIRRGLPIRAWAMPKRWRIPPEKPARAFLRTLHRLTWFSRASTVCLRSLPSAMPFSTAMWSSMS